MIYKELRITNFKRFAGENVFPLTGDGNVTIIAAKNSEGDSVIERLGTETGEDNKTNILGDDLLPPSDTDDPLTPPKSD